MISYHIGIDGGGSGCRAILADANGQVIGQGTAGPANIGADIDNALRHIIEASRLAIFNANAEPSILRKTNAVLGLAGANSVSDHEAIYKVLPFASCRIVSDAITAIQGALGDGEGVNVILGTGSAFVKRAGGLVEVIGGRGFMLSDHAGGARLGREVLEAALLAYDGMGDLTGLTDAVLARFDEDAHKITAFSRTASAADYAAFAPLVLDHAAEHDTLALSIMHRACESIRRGLERLNVERLGRFTVTGGLASSYTSLPFLPYRTFYTPPLGDALQGALSLALQSGGRD